MVDYPGCTKFYRQIADYYPDAKVLHSVRDPDKWFDSTQATIFSPANITRMTSGTMRAFAEGFIGDLVDHIHDRAYMTAHFKRHDEEVRCTIPKEELVFEASQGWPLCASRRSRARHPVPQRELTDDPRPGRAGDAALKLGRTPAHVKAAIQSLTRYGRVRPVQAGCGLVGQAFGVCSRRPSIRALAQAGSNKERSRFAGLVVVGSAMPISLNGRGR